MEESQLYSKSQYQSGLLGRAAAASTDPRILKVQLNVPIDVLEQYWDPACKQNRAPSMHGYPQGCALRERLDVLHNRFRVYWESDNLKDTMPRTWNGINDLRIYKTWYMDDEMGSEDGDDA